MTAARNLQEERKFQLYHLFSSHSPYVYITFLCLASSLSFPDPQALPVSFNFYSYFWHVFFLTEYSDYPYNPSGEELKQPRIDPPLPLTREFPEENLSLSNRNSCPAWEALDNSPTLRGKSKDYFGIHCHRAVMS